jgi:hypothetical protein
MERARVYKLIDGERKYQDKKWNGPRTVGEELFLLETLMAKAKPAWADHNGDFEALAIIRKIAAVAVRCMENHSTPPRFLTDVEDSPAPASEPEPGRVSPDSLEYLTSKPTERCPICGTSPPCPMDCR